LHRSDDKKDFFAPSDWQAFDARDADLGGTNPLPLDIPTQNGNQALILALGKDGKAYLLDRHNLGGIGGSLAVETVDTHAIITAPAAYPAADGVFVAFRGPGAYLMTWRDSSENPPWLSAHNNHGLVRPIAWSRITDRDHHGWAFESYCVDRRRRGR